MFNNFFIAELVYISTAPWVFLFNVYYHNTLSTIVQLFYTIFNPRLWAVSLIFTAVKRAVYTLVKTLRAELSELYEEKKRLYPEYYVAKDEYRDIDVMKSNVDSIIGKIPHEHEQERSRKKNKDELE